VRHERVNQLLIFHLKSLYFTQEYIFLRNLNSQAYGNASTQGAMAVFFRLTGG